MNKRGQVYILVALILAVALYILLTKTNLVFETVTEDDFEELSKNYDLESAKFVNSLLAEGRDDVGYVETEFKEFTERFTDYSQRQNPDFGLIYVFNYKGNLHVGNYLSKGWIYIWPEYEPVYYPFCSYLETESMKGDFQGWGFSMDIPSGGTCCYGNIESKAEEAELIVEGILYIIPIVPDRPELVIIGSETKGEFKKVYIGEFIEGDFAKTFGNDFCERIDTTDPLKILDKDTKEKYRKLGSGRCEGGVVKCGLFYKNNKNGCIIDDSCCWDEGVCKQGAC